MILYEPHCHSIVFQSCNSGTTYLAMASGAPTVTTGGKGMPFHIPIHCPPPSPLSLVANPCPEPLTPMVSLYVPVFANDPVIAYMLCSMPTQSARLAYLPDYFQTLL